jgi:hypothetical protein
MNIPLFVCGLGIWISATIALRFAGQYVLHPNDWKGTLILFSVSFALMAWLVRRLCRRFGLEPGKWPSGAISLALPTLMLDPFSAAFFPVVFPNMAPEVAGVFGGWMLCCCSGALVGAIFPCRTHA